MKSLIYYHDKVFSRIAKHVANTQLGKQRAFPVGYIMLRYMLPSVSLVDRTGTLDFGFHTTVLTPIPTFNGAFAKTFSQICNERARALIDTAIAEGKHMDIFWSGGIDSTVALIGILTQSTAGERANMTVHYNQRSLLEYPGFYETHIVPNFTNTSEFTYNIKANITLDNMVVTGELGDQLFGNNLNLMFAPTYPFPANEHDNTKRNAWQTFSAQVSATMDVTFLNQPWEAEVKRVIKSNVDARTEEVSTFVDDNWADFMTWITPFVNAAPFQINTVQDFMWWINFALKWQDVKLRMVADDHLTAAKIGNLHHFFESDDFQQWAMQPTNHANKIAGSTWGTYKQTAKQYILDFTSDLNYYNDKTKLGSLQYVNSHGFPILLDTYEHIRFGEHNANWKLFDLKYTAGYLNDLFTTTNYDPV